MNTTIALPVPANGFQPDECSAAALRPARVPTFDTPPEHADPWSFVSFDRRKGGIYTRENLQRAQWTAEDFGTIDEEPEEDGSWFVRDGLGFVVGSVRPATADEIESWRADAEAC